MDELKHQESNPYLIDLASLNFSDIIIGPISTKPGTNIS